VEEYGYEFSPYRNWFVVRGKDRCTTRVRYDMENFCWYIQFDSVGWHTRHPVSSHVREVSEVVYPYDTYNLTRLIADALMHNWQPNRKRYNEDGTRNTKYWYGVRDWAKEQTAKAIYTRVREQWERIFNDLYEPRYLLALKSVYVNTNRHLHPVMSGVLHSSSPVLWEDVIKYRAAAHAMSFWEDSWTRPNQSNWTSTAYATRVGGLGRSKRRTIMNLPYPMSNTLVSNLRWIHLDRPIFDRIELSWACALFRSFVREFPVDFSDVDHLKHATREDISRAVDKLSKYYDAELGYRPTRSKTLIDMADFIRDGARYDMRVITGSDTVNSAMKKSVDIHRGMARQDDIYRMLNAYKAQQIDPSTETKKPPIDLLDDDCIRFLSTVEEVWAEGALMNHCIDSYADSAVRGFYYIFHIDYQGESATAAVENSGRYVQCLGPYNRVNKASEYGQAVLSRWMKGFAHPPSSVNFNTHWVEDAALALPQGV